MKVQEVIRKAMGKKITGWQAAESIGIGDRQMRRWRKRYEQYRYGGPIDRRQGPSPPADPGRPGVARAGRAHDSGLLAAGAGPAGAQLLPLAGTAATGTAAARIRTVEKANRFLREEYIAEFGRRFQVPAAGRGTAFMACPRRDLNLVLSLQFERAVNCDNTGRFRKRVLQIDTALWRGTYARQRRIDFNGRFADSQHEENQDRELQFINAQYSTPYRRMATMSLRQAVRTGPHLSIG